MENLPSSLPLDLYSPWLNAAGTLGFAPGPAWNWPRLQGAFITNPISLHARKPAHNPAAVAFPGGALLHSGLPNPGLRRVLRAHAAAWRRSSLPIWPHLFGAPEEIAAMARQLEEVEGVAALEISIPIEADAGLALSLLQAARGELPLIACLPLQLARAPWLAGLAAAGASALHLDAPRGQITGIGGRLTGPGLLPLALDALQAAQASNLPVIAGSGVFTCEDGEKLLKAGALAVAVDTALWR
jgi:dihydroorotate dehydrogenase (NAD+) catalytic subunit